MIKSAFIVKFRLTLSQTTKDSTNLRKFANDNFNFDEKSKKFSEWVENTVGKEKNCLLQAISPFPSVF